MAQGAVVADHLERAWFPGKISQCSDWICWGFSWPKGARENQPSLEPFRAAVEGETWWFHMSIRLQNGLSQQRGEVGGESWSVGWCGAPHNNPFIPPQPPLGLSSEHPLPALNLRSRHTLRSGEGAPLVGRGRWREQDVILSLARLQRQASTREGGEELRGQGGCKPLAQPPCRPLAQPSCRPAHLVHSCSRRREPRESRGMEEAVWGEPFTP